jgi:hypothetical protein
LLILTPSLRLRSQGHAEINRSSEERDAMRPEQALTPGFSASRQKGAGAERVPLGVRERGQGRGDSGSTPDVPREPGPYDPESPGVGVVGVLVAWVTISEIGQRISEVVRSIIAQGVEVITPLATIVAIGQIIFGLLLIALRQEFIGLRWIIGGIILLVALYIVIPLLLSFI